MKKESKQDLETYDRKRKRETKRGERGRERDGRKTSFLKKKSNKFLGVFKSAKLT